MRILLGDEVVYHDNGTATITKRSAISGKTNSHTMKLTEEQYNDWVTGGMLIQKAMPHLTSDEREFLMTGITPAEWNKEFGEE